MSLAKTFVLNIKDILELWKSQMMNWRKVAAGYGSLDAAAGKTEVFYELWLTRQWPIHLNILQFGGRRRRVTRKYEHFGPNLSLSVGSFL